MACGDDKVGKLVAAVAIWDAGLAISHPACKSPYCRAGRQGSKAKQIVQGAVHSKAGTARKMRGFHV